MTETDDAGLNHLASRLGDFLRVRGWSLTCAESCTGGWVAKVVTEIPGSSDWFDRGFVTYSNAAKQEMIGVQASTLANHGAVSEQVVLEMAAGALRESRAQLAVAISGIAGPGGGTPEKPVGTVWFAWMSSVDGGVARCLRFDGNRDQVRRQAVACAFQGLIGHLETAHA